MSTTKLIEVPDFVVGERVGLGPDHNNPGTILEIKAGRARVRFGVHPPEYRNWYGLDELYALPIVKIGDRVGYRSVNDPNPGTVVKIEHSRAEVDWDRGGVLNRWFMPDDLVVIPPAEPAITWDIDNVFASGQGFQSEGFSPFTPWRLIDFSGASNVEAEPETYIVALINEDGAPRPSCEPVVHRYDDEAAGEANRLAQKYPGKEFGVFQLVASARCEIVATKVA